MNKDDPNKKYYFKEASQDEIKSFFDALKTGNSQVSFTLWEKGQEEKTETMTHMESSEESKRIYMRLEGSLLKTFLESSFIEKEVLIKTHINRFVYFSNATLELDPESSLYSIELSKPLFISQQRKDLRLPANRLNDMRIQIGEEVIELKDISAGGVSFVLDEDSTLSFEAGDETGKVRIQFDKELYTVNKMKIVKTDFDEDGLFVAAQFVDISPDDETRLSRQISMESRALQALDT